MTDQAAIVLSDGTLSEICGVNDENLRVFEDLLGVGIHSRGNELVLETQDQGVWHTFKSMIGSLEARLKLGEVLSPPLVRGLYEAIHSGDQEKTDLLTDASVTIPKVGRKIFAKSVNQASYLRAMTANDLIFSIGPAGTGKTYLAVAHALAGVLARKKRRLVLTRPVVEAGESLGYLPGDLAQKISPYLRPLYDAMEDLLSPEMVRSMEDNKTIEVAPLAYMRGRTISDAYILLDEAQNTTREQMKMFLTRIGMETQAIVTGDITQIDLPRRGESGLVHVRSILRSIDQIAFVHFDDRDVVRNPLVRKIIHAYEAEEGTR